MGENNVEIYIILGRDHPDTLHATANLAALLKEQELFEDSKKLYDQVLQDKIR